MNPTYEELYREVWPSVLELEDEILAPMSREEITASKARAVIRRHKEMNDDDKPSD